MYGGVSCNACGKGMSGDQMRSGHYVCLICEDDFHKDCVIRDEALEAELDNKIEEEGETKKEGAE